MDANIWKALFHPGKAVENATIVALNGSVFKMFLNPGLFPVAKRRAEISPVTNHSA